MGKHPGGALRGVVLRGGGPGTEGLRKNLQKIEKGA